MLGLGVGAGLGISIYEKHTPSNQQQNSPVTPPTPVASNTVEPQNTPSYITYILRGHSGKVTSQGNRILILKAQNLEEVLIAPASLEPFGFDPHLCRFFLP